MTPFHSPTTPSIVARLTGTVVGVITILVAPASLAMAAPTPSPTPNPGIAAVCDQAAASVALGYPQRALTQLDQLTEAERSIARCSTPRYLALQRVAAAERLALAASQLKAAGGTLLAPVERGPLLTSCSVGAGLPAGPDQVRLLQTALDCDRENATALALSAALPGPTTSEVAAATWSNLAGRWIAPWEEVALAFVLWLVSALVLLQLMPLWTGAWRLTRGTSSKATLWGGRILVFGGAVLGTFAAARWAYEWWAVVLAVAVTTLGLFVWDYWRRRQLKLLVLVDGKDTDKAASNLQGIIADLGSANPRGMQSPIGPDTTFLKEVDLTSFGAGKWTNAVTSLVLALKPHTPWELGVDVVSDDRLAVRLRRNHRVIASEIVDRTWLRLTPDYFAKIEGKPAKDEVVPSLWAFPAALALVRIGEMHDSMRGLAGATNWRSIALQHIATTELNERAAAKKCLLGQALDLDPANDGAALAYWQTIYPGSKNVAELAAYSRMLTSLIERHDADEDEDAALVLRARFSLTATLINLGYSTVPPDSGAPARRAWDELRMLRSGVEAKNGPAAELARTMRPRVEALEASIENLESPAAVHPVTINGGPRISYSKACALVPAKPTDPLWEGNAEAAVAQLQLADTNLDLADFKVVDPQLAALRGRKEFVAKYGDKVPTDILTVAPFVDWATLLRRRRLTNASLIACAGLEYLRSLRICERDAWSLIRTARLAKELQGTALEPWAIPIAVFLAGRLKELLLDGSLRAEVAKDLARFEKPPSNTQLVDGLGDPKVQKALLRDVAAEDDPTLGDDDAEAVFVATSYSETDAEGRVHMVREFVTAHGPTLRDANSETQDEPGGERT